MKRRRLDSGVNFMSVGAFEIDIVVTEDVEIVMRFEKNSHYLLVSVINISTS